MNRPVNYLERYFWLILVFSALVGVLISIYIGSRQSVWFDEAYSTLVAEHSWGEIIRLTVQDVHPPVYYWVLKAWMSVFGSSELVLRSMSSLFLGLAAATAGVLLRRLFGVKAAVTALPFLGLAPFLLRYGFEIRMYTLASFIGVAATYLLVLAVEETSKKKRWLLFFAYAMLAMVGLYTLYLMALLWIAHFLWLAWITYMEKKRDIILPVLVSYAVSFLFFLPWLPVFMSSATSNSLSPVTHHLGLENLYGVSTFVFLYKPPWEMVGVGAIIMALALAMIGYVSYRALKNTTGKERRYLMLLVVYFLVPILTLVIVTQFKPIYIERYIAHFAIGIYMCLGVVVALALRNANNVTYAATGGLVTLLLFGCMNVAQTGNYNYQRLHLPAVKDVAALLSDCEDGAIIFADGPQVAMELNYYIKDCPVYFFNETYEMSGGFAMFDKSPLRVADSTELPKTDKILHVYYDEPKRTIPQDFTLESVKTIEALSVASYQAQEK